MALLIIILAFVVLAAGFAIYLITQDQGEREPVGALWTAFGFGLLGMIAAAFIEQFVLPDLSKLDQLPQGSRFWMAMAVGFIEELCKAGLLVWFIYRKRYFNEHTDGVIYFALAGLGFGLPENILYTLQFGSGAGLSRVILTPLFHAATTGLVGYALIKVKLDRATKLSFITMLAMAILIHGFYDFGLFSKQVLLMVMSIMITAGVTAGLFILYFAARGKDQEQGLSVVGNNSFCRSCGTPNPEHKLYCTRCGNRA
jgi:RsiW-degrading membrane proteinase PrsW (M82 family)